MNYGIKMKTIRENNNISQEQMANILNIKRSTYGHYETEYQIIPINHLINFCKYFNISLDYIFGFIKENKGFKNKEWTTTLVGKRLKEIRKELDLTQEALSIDLNTTKSVICDYEKGRYLIATPFLYTICKKYKISADYILGINDKSKYLKSND